MKPNLVIGAFVLLGLLMMATAPAYAHGRTQVGEYELVIGFHIEPAYQSEPNGLDLFVTDTRTGERVNGLEESLQVEIIYGGSSKTLQLEPQFGQEGAYTAHVLPTQAGDYTWHISGAIGDTPVDVSMTSSPETFSPVAAKSAISFPDNEPVSTELSEQAGSAARVARIALVAGIAGAVLGLLGLTVGFLGWQAARQQVG